MGMTHTEPSDRAVLVYVTVPGRDEALRIGQDVVEKRLAACANIVPAISSIYWWDGQVQHDDEALLLLKSRAALWEQLRSAIVALHPYEVPAISTIPLENVHDPYLKWLIGETKVD